MNCLLDTHAFLWLIGSSQQLSEKVKLIVKNKNNNIYVSALTFWEIAIKVGIKKLTVSGFGPEDLPEIAKKSNLEIITPNAVEFASCHLLEIKKDHKDPFDRMLIWQALKRDLSILSCDNHFQKYKGLKVIW
jgi:PIN domain nuclease of toxin-antitoxin system